MGIEGNFFNLIKSIYRKRTAVTTLNGGRLCAVPELRTRQGGHAHAISTVLEVQPGQSQQEKKKAQIGKEEIIVPIFRWYHLSTEKYPKESKNKNILE